MAKSLKKYYSSSEVATLLGIDIGTLYYWERSYNILPERSSTQRRRYTPRQVEQLRTVYYLVKEKGLKGEAVKRVLSDNAVVPAEERKAEALAALKRADKTVGELMQQLKRFYRAKMVKE